MQLDLPLQNSTRKKEKKSPRHIGNSAFHFSVTPPFISSSYLPVRDVLPAADDVVLGVLLRNRKEKVLEDGRVRERHAALSRV